MPGLLRPVFVAVAVVALGATWAAVGGDERPPGEGQQVVAVGKAALSRPALAERTPRPVLISAVLAGTALALTAAVSARRGGTAQPLWRRRLDDVGDDWRSLLLGAPPAAA